MASNFGWLHFSDLHFNSFDNKADVRDIREKLKRCLRTMHGNCSNLKYVFITGDIADKGEYSPNTTRQMKDLINEFMDLGVEAKNIFWCCGNHDIPRNGLTHQNILRMFVNCARNENPPYEEIMNNLDDRRLIVHCRLDAYFDKYEEYFNRAANPELQEAEQIHFFYALDELNLIVLNTCITSFDDADEGQLHIMEANLHDVFENIDKSKPTFVIGHHGLEFLCPKDQKLLGLLFEDYYVDYYLCGHSHNLSCRELPNLSTNIREFTAGGMLADGHAQAVFYLGQYSASRSGVHLTPYVYGTNKRFEPDYKFDRAFSEHQWYESQRLRQCTKEIEVNLTSFSEAKENSQKFYDSLRKGHGRFAGIHVNDNIIPDAGRRYFDAYVSSTESTGKVKLLDLVAAELKAAKGIVLTGEGGSGKTTALLRIWEKELQNDEYVPVYIPLNEYNSVKELDGFIEIYLENRYHISIGKADYRILMLLDGFNEITERQSEASKEINSLLLRYGERLRIIITSRREMRLCSLLNVMEHYVLRPLDECTVREYLQETNIPVLEEVFPVLITPMMLTIYTSTCFIQSEVQKELRCDFMRADSKAAIIYNYLLCQLGKVVLDNQETDILSTYSHIFFKAPYIAHRMESAGSFYIDTENLSPLERECDNIFDEDYILDSAGRLLGSRVYHEQKSKNMVLILVFRQHLLMEEEKRYFFRHQHFRDFLSALNIVNYLKKSTLDGIKLLKDRQLPEALLEMICGMNTIIGIEEWRLAFHELRNLDSNETGYAIHNVLMILSGLYRKNRFESLGGKEQDKKWYLPAIAEEFEGLNFESVNLYGLLFSSYKKAFFTNCKFSLANFLSPGHHSSVTCVQYYMNTDERRIALTASLDGDIKEWDLKSGECISVCHTGDAATYAAYGKDGNSIFVAGTDHVVCRITRDSMMNKDRNFTQELVRYSGHTKDIKCIDICSDGEFFLTAANEPVMREWSVKSDGEHKRFIGSESAICVARYSACNRYVITGARSGEVRVWDRKSACTQWSFKAHKKSITDISVSPDGSCFLTASSDTFIKEWKIIYGKDGCFQQVQEEAAAIFKGHADVVTSVHYNNAGDKVLTSSSDSKVILWDRESAQILKKFQNHANRVNWAAFSPKGDRVLSADYSGQVIETDIETNLISFNVKGVDDRNNCMIKIDDDSVLVGTSDGMVKVWDVSRHRCCRILPGHDKAVKCISKYMDRLYTAGEDKKLYAWSYANGLVEKIVHLGAVPRSMDLSDDGQRLILGLDDYSIVEFDAVDLELRKIYRGADGFIEGVKYLNGTESFVSVSKDRRARLWHSGIDQSRVIYECAKTNLYAVEYDRIKNSVYIADQNMIIELDGEQFKEIHRFEGHGTAVNVIHADSAKRRILAGLNDGRVWEWELDHYTAPREIAGCKSRISGVAYCAEYIIAASYNGRVAIWDKMNGDRPIWSSRPYGRINIAGCKFNKCTFTDEEVKAVIIENGGIIEE